MLTNYLKIAYRNIIGDRVLSIIKIIGLMLGLTVCLLILLYTKDEMTFDQFHANKSVLYRIAQTWLIGDSPAQKIGVTNSVMGETFAKEIAGVEKYSRINGRTVTIMRGKEVFTQNVLCVDENFFEVFSFDMLSGSRSAALSDMYSVAVCESMARKYFGSTDALGKNISIKLADNFEVFQVTAVLPDPPKNSSIQPEILLSMKFNEKYNDNKGWLGGSMNTFLLLSKNTNVSTAERSMQSIFDKHSSEMLAKASEQGMKMNVKVWLQPFEKLHLSNDPGPDNGLANGGKPVYSYILTCIAVFILVIACINFINLTVAQSLKRSKEIGIRKVIGGSRKQLMFQFLAESFIISIISFIGAVIVTQAALPIFNDLAEKKLELSYLADVYLYAGFFLLLVIASILAGFYPAVVLSGFQPVKVLYSRMKFSGRNYFTRGLVVFQFALAILLIIGTVTINTQLDFLINADLGFNKDNLVRLEIPVSKASETLPSIFKAELMGQPNIVDVGARNAGNSFKTVKVDGKQIASDQLKIDDNFLSTMDIEILAGRNFSPSVSGDSTNAVLINESFLKEAGWTVDQAIGRIIQLNNEETRPVTVIGVIKDFHFFSLRRKIGPVMFVMQPDFNFGEVWVRISPNDVPTTLRLLETTFKKVVPLFPYRYTFMDEINAREYAAELNWQKIIGLASGLFLFISCIGLLGLVMLSIEQRTKEIGIRRVLGAAVSSIVGLVTREFLLLIILAFVIATPLGYYVLEQWLQSFAYRIAPAWRIYPLVGVLVLLVAWLIMALQAVRAGFTDPVKNLRSE